MGFCVKTIEGMMMISTVKDEPRIDKSGSEVRMVYGTTKAVYWNNVSTKLVLSSMVVSQTISQTNCR